MRSLLTMALLLTQVLLCPVQAAEKAPLKLQGLSIVGDKELPKILYIVPWKTHKATKITAPSYKSSLEDDFTFINKPSLQN